MYSRKGRKKNKQSAQRRDQASLTTYGTTLFSRQPIPDNMIIDLKYQDSTISRNNAGAVYCSWRYRLNAVYDPDPLVGSGSITGYNEWAAMYQSYRVIGFRYEVTLVNMESFPVVVYLAPTLFDAGANYSSINQISEFPYGRKNMLSMAGGQDRCYLAGDISIARLEGSKSVFTDDYFTSPVTSNPTNVRYLNIGFEGPTTLVKGLLISVRLIYRTQFYRRQNLVG